MLLRFSSLELNVIGDNTTTKITITVAAAISIARSRLRLIMLALLPQPTNAADFDFCLLVHNDLMHEKGILLINRNNTRSWSNHVMVPELDIKVRLWISS